MPGPTRAEQRRQQALVQRLSEIGFVLPGRLLSRHMRCGKTNCRCRLDPPELHGPYIQWNRMVDGKTATRLMPADIADRYQDWFDNAAQLRTTISELETLAVTIAERDRQSRPRR